MQDAVAKLCRKPGLAITTKEHAWEIHILKPDDLEFEILVPYEVLEWFVTARQVSTKQEIWTDWMDYYEMEGEPQANLRSCMEVDIERFIERLLASTFRIVQSRAFFTARRCLEWRTAGTWERVRMYSGKS